MDVIKSLLGNLTIDNADQTRKILLGAYLIILYFFVDLFFFLANIFNPQGIPWILISGAGVAILSLALLRYRHTNLAIFIYLVRANIILYFFTFQEGPETGTFIYFISYGITPLAFYGYQDRWKGIVYAGISLIIFMVTMFHPADFRPDNAHFYFISNFTIVLFTVSFILLFFDRMNEKAVLKISMQNIDLVKVNSELDRFVYSVSHDLRSPLASILGLVKIYEMSNSEEERGKIIVMIQDRTMKLDDFISKILDYSRNARKDLIKESILLAPMIYEILQTLQFNQGYERIHFEIDIPDKQTIVSDPERLKVVLTNLLSNAIRYRDETKGKSIVRVSAKSSHQFISITLEDNGVGISRNHLPRIFEMFYRAHSFSIGSGIGLYIVEECLNKIGGNITVQSEYGKGSTFTVLLPQIE